MDFGNILKVGGGLASLIPGVGPLVGAATGIAGDAISQWTKKPDAPQPNAAAPGTPPGGAGDAALQAENEKLKKELEELKAKMATSAAPTAASPAGGIGGLNSNVL